MKWINKIRSWWCKLWGKPDPEEQARELLDQAFDKFANLVMGIGLSGDIVNTYKNAIIIQNIIDGDWGDIWDFSLWENRGIIGWTMIDHWKPINEYFDPNEYEDPEEAYQMYQETMKKPKIMIADVYEYKNGSYGINMKNRIDLWFQDGTWYLI